MMRINLKSTLLSAIGIFAIAAVFTISSCKEDVCKTVVCAYNGVCQDDGSCKCQVGYEGERCETITREKFKGVWTVVEDGTATNPSQYAVSVENGDKINQVIIRNIYNQFDQTVTAQVDGDTMYIPAQPILVGNDTFTVQGKGYAVPEAYYGLHGKIILDYVVSFTDGTQDMFGINGNKNPSIWTK